MHSTQSRHRLVTELPEMPTQVKVIKPIRENQVHSTAIPQPVFGRCEGQPDGCGGIHLFAFPYCLSLHALEGCKVIWQASLLELYTLHALRYILHPLVCLLLFTKTRSQVGCRYRSVYFSSPRPGPKLDADTACPNSLPPARASCTQHVLPASSICCLRRTCTVQQPTS